MRDDNDVMFRMFEAVALAGNLVDVALVPGWVWARGQFEVVPVLIRLGIAAAALGVAVGAGVFGTLFLLVIAGTIWPQILAWPSWYGVAVPSLFVVFVSVSAGTVVGTGAAAAQEADRRSGSEAFPRARARTHVIGGIAGVAMAIGALVAAAGLWTWFPALATWPMLPILPLVAVLVGLPHNVLVLRDAVCGGTSLPAPRLALVRAGVCATAMVLVGAGLLVTAP